MFSSTLLRYDRRGDSIEPCYLDERFAPLARTLLLHYEAFEGMAYHRLAAALDRHPELTEHEPRLVAGLRRVIEEGLRLETRAPVDPPRVREAVFELARRDRGLDPQAVLRAAGERLGIPDAAVEGALYADLPNERTIRFVGPLPSVATMISRYNLRLLQGLLLHSERLRIEVRGHARSVYRFAKLHGLLLEVKDAGGGDALVLEVTGPLSILRRTVRYGRALARFLPACCAAGRFRVEANLMLRERRGLLVVTPEDRVLSTHRPPREFDSKVEKRLFQDFSRLGSRWEMTREAQLIATPAGVFFPDFTFRARTEPTVAVDLEIVGFWTRDYLARKRRLAGHLGGRKVIFCVDERLAAADDSPPQPCILFSRRVPAQKVLEALEACAADGLQSLPG